MIIQEYLPSVFIGSSTEAIDVAREIELQLEKIANIILWSNSFQPGDYPLEALLRNVSQCDFAILVITPDDFLRSRNQDFLSARDNVVFELGLFMNQLGRQRTFIVCEHDDRLKIPSDLLGITTIRFQRRDNLSSSLSPTCTIIIKKIRELKIYNKQERFIEEILEQYKQGTLMTSWHDIYERAIKLVLQAERRIRVTSFGGNIWQGNTEYIENIAKVARQKKDVHADFVHKAVFYQQNKTNLEETIENNIISRINIFKKLDVLELLQIRTVPQIWGIDFLIVDDRHAHLSFQRAVGNSLFLGIEFTDFPQLVKPLSEWYDESIFSIATPYQYS